MPQLALPPSSAATSIDSLVTYRYGQVSCRSVLINLAVMFVAWLPYLFVYWPGFVFGDTGASIFQAVAGLEWNNHHPILFMLLLKLAMHIMKGLGFSRTSGLALYSIFQMVCYGAVFASLVMVLVFWLFAWHKDAGVSSARIGAVVASLAVAVLASWAITGPLYTAIGVKPTEKVEQVGIALNQMARVAAVGGDMSQSDREYLNSILPIEQYADKYRPCCTDMLKWDEEFSDEALEQGDFWAHWWSMLVRNPKEYVQAWILQTYGFWTFNEPKVASYANNIGHGDLQLPDTFAEHDILLPDYRADTQLHRLFPYNGHCIPEGLLFWVLLYLALVLCLQGRWTWLLGLVPSGALMLTLFIASPAWYWPRYACLIQFLIPFYLALFLANKFECKQVEG